VRCANEPAGTGGRVTPEILLNLLQRQSTLVGLIRHDPCHLPTFAGSLVPGHELLRVVKQPTGFGEFGVQRRWEESLRARVAISPHSPVRLLDDLLAHYRVVHREKLISQIPPKTSDYPTTQIG
jgi:hypothetical protein